MRPFKFERKNIKFGVLDHLGRLYIVDLVNKNMSEFFYETGPNPYQAFRYPNQDDDDYVDLDTDGETLCHFSPGGSKKRIAGSSQEELAEKISHIFQTSPKTAHNENSTTMGGFKIVTTDWVFGIDDKWHLRYRLLNILNQQGLKLKVYYCRTPERLIELQNELGLRGFPDDGVLTRMMNNSRREI